MCPLHQECQRAKRRLRPSWLWIPPNPNYNRRELRRHRPPTDGADGITPVGRRWRMTATAQALLDRQVSEKQFQQQIVAFARLNGWRVYHPYDSRRSAAGWPDLALARLCPSQRGVTTELLFLECKTERGRLTEAQRDWLFVLNAAPGVVARVVRPSDWPEIVALLSRRPAHNREEA